MIVSMLRALMGDQQFFSAIRSKELALLEMELIFHRRKPEGMEFGRGSPLELRALMFSAVRKIILNHSPR